MHLPSLPPEKLKQLLAASRQELQLSEEAFHRLAWILHFATNGGSMEQTCAAFNITTSTFRRWLRRFDPEDLSLLEEKSHRPISVRKSAVADATVEHIRAYRTAQPLIGKERIAELLLAEHGIILSSSTINRVIERECLYFADTPLHWKKRLEREQRETVGEAIALSIPEIQSPESRVQSPVRLHESTMDIEHAGPVDNHTTLDHDCVWCKFKSFDWKRIGKSFAVACVVTNLIFTAIIGTTLYLERKKAKEIAERDTRPSVLIDGELMHSTAPTQP